MIKVRKIVVLGNIIQAEIPTKQMVQIVQVNTETKAVRENGNTPVSETAQKVADLLLKIHEQDAELLTQWTVKE